MKNLTLRELRAEYLKTKKVETEEREILTKSEIQDILNDIHLKEKKFDILKRYGLAMFNLDRITVDITNELKKNLADNFMNEFVSCYNDTITTKYDEGCDYCEVIDVCMSIRKK